MRLDFAKQLPILQIYNLLILANQSDVKTSCLVLPLRKMLCYKTFFKLKLGKLLMLFYCSIACSIALQST